MSDKICPEEQCTGCGACVNTCHKACIRMVFDKEGFLRPEIDSVVCDDCGDCKAVCPILNPCKPDHSAEQKVFACWNRNEGVRFQSASGGAFSAFASNVLQSGGIVFGAAFDEDMNLRHVPVSREKDLGKIRSSKYLQSDVAGCYKNISELLVEKRKVLFVGTPCQVAGLKATLGEQENLFSCDLVCKGVASPGLFAKYVADVEKRYEGKLVNINPRHKRSGWQLVTTMAFFGDGRECVLTGYDNSFMYGYSHGFTMRSSCYCCPFSRAERCGDITLGDFWKIGENIPFSHDTRNGISLTLINSEKGCRLFEESLSRLFFEERTFAEAKSGQSALGRSMRKPEKRGRFFADFQRLAYEELANRYLVDAGLKGLIKKITPRGWIFNLRKIMKKIGIYPH